MITAVLGKAFLLIASVLFTVQLIPQLVKTIKTKKVEGISALWLGLASAAYISFELGFALTKNWFMLISYLIPAAATLVLFSLILKYRRKDVAKR